MKIVNIIQRYPPAVGGAELWGQEVCRYLARQGHVVRVCTLAVNHEEEFWRDPPDDAWTLRFGPFGYDEGVAVRRYQRSMPIPTIWQVVYKQLLDRWLNIYFYGPHSGEMYGRLWREIKPADVVFLHALPHPHNHVAFLIAKLLGKKTVMVPHFHPTHPFYERWSNYWLLRHCDAVMTVTEYEKTYLQARGVAAEKLYVTGNGVHLETYQVDNLEATRRALAQQHGLQPDERVVTFIGRKVPEKGVADLIVAIKALRPHLPVRLFLVGPELEWFRDLYADLSPEDRTYIVDLGLVSHQEKVNILHLSDLLALPSKYEAFGIVFLEAWACGIPVVGSSEGAIPSVVGQEGLVCTFGDVHDLARTLKQAFAHPQTLREMGARGQTKVRTQYTWDAIGKTAEQALRAAYGGKRKLLLVTGQQGTDAECEAARQALLQQLTQHGYETRVFVVTRQNMAEDQSLPSCVSEGGMSVHRMCLSSAVGGLGLLSAESAQIRPIRDQFAKMLDDFAPDGVYFHGLLGVSLGLCQVVQARHMPLLVSCLPAWGTCPHQLPAAAGETKHDCLHCPACLPVLAQDGEFAMPLRLRHDFVALQLQTASHVLMPEPGAPAQVARIARIAIDTLFGVATEESTPLSVRPSAAGPFLVCVGRTFSAPARQALAQILAQNEHPWRILMAEWLDEAQLKQAVFVWVVDQDVTFEQVEIGLRNQLPLLVPQAARELAQLCVSRQCGLSYRDALEAVACVRRLTDGTSLGKTLGMNGFRLFYEQASGAPTSTHCV